MSEKDLQDTTAPETEAQAETAKAETETNAETEVADRTKEILDQAEEVAPETLEPQPEHIPTEEEQAEARLKAAENKAAEAEKQRLFALAEMENQRKRFAKELENHRYRTTQDTLFPFLQVFDHFTMAVKAAEAPGAGVDALLKGMEMIQNEFDKAFQELGVEKVDAVGKKFDPNLHEAVAEEASDTVESGVVIRQWCMGFRMKDRLLKPAMVVVSKGPEKQEKEEEETAKE